MKKHLQKEQVRKKISILSYENITCHHSDILEVFSLIKGNYILRSIQQIS